MSKLSKVLIQIAVCLISVFVMFPVTLKYMSWLGSNGKAFADSPGCVFIFLIWVAVACIICATIEDEY